MKSEWNVESNYINGKPMYRVYRIRDTEETDHSGNREYAGEYVRDSRMALVAAKALNELEERR